MEKPVLVVVDVQEGFVNEHSRSAIPRIGTVVGELLKRQLPIVFTKFLNLPDSSFERLLDWTSVRERPEIELHRSILPVAKIVIEKSSYTAFTDEFRLLREEAGWETLLICGISTESCILKTAVDAFELGVRPVVISDACASDQGPGVHEKGIEILEILIGKRQIVTVHQLLSALERKT